MATKIGKNVKEVFEECLESKFSFTAYDVYTEAKNRGRCEGYEVIENWMLNQDVGNGHFRRINVTDGIRYVLYVSKSKVNCTYDDTDMVKYLSKFQHSGFKTKSGKKFSDSTDRSLKINAEGIRINPFGRDRKMMISKYLTVMAGLSVGDIVYAHVENGMIVINKDPNDVLETSYRIAPDGRFQLRRGKFIQFLGVDPKYVRAYVSEGAIYLKPEK